MSSISVNTDREYARITQYPSEAGPYRWIGRCKKCKRTHKLEGSIVHAQLAKFPTRSDLVVKTTGGVLYTTGALGTDPSRVPVRCGDHWATLHRVTEGNKKSKHQCGARCTNATGPNCDCRCKGASHGSGC